MSGPTFPYNPSSREMSASADPASGASAPYTKSLLSIRVALAITEVGRGVKARLERKICAAVEGRCIEHGYVMPDSVSIVNHSSGVIAGDIVEFCAVYECHVCFPVEGVELDAVVRTITKAGIHAHVLDARGNSPITVFIAREHHHNESHFAAVHEGAKITATVIGARFELNDPCICVIASLNA